jgi:hypothetical protein
LKLIFSSHSGRHGLLDRTANYLPIDVLENFSYQLLQHARLNIAQVGRHCLFGAGLISGE